MRTFRDRAAACGLLAFLLAALALAARPATADDRAKAQATQSAYQAMKAENFPGVADTDAATLSRALAAPGAPVLVDVRSAAERAVSMLPGALDAAAFERALADGTLAGRPVVVYCTIGYRSGRYVDRLRARAPGLTLANLAGGILAWTQAGGALHQAGTPTRAVWLDRASVPYLADGYTPAR